MTKQTLMVQGTTSDAGKSVLVTALCRVLLRRGYSVAPFKPQNMALNSAVTADGGEIGRAQAVQAQACGLQPCINMNPVLLKPNTDIGAQVIVHGKVHANMDAQSYHLFKPTLLQAVLDSYEQLQQQYDYVIVEGAGSPAEINLRDTDIANMGFAEAADCPVIIVADIDKGGVFAHLVGTLDLLSATERQRVVGFVINKFRGDLSLLEPGLRWLEEKTHKPVWGVLPYIPGFHLEAEDAIPRNSPVATTENAIKVIVPVFSRISNHTDFDPLRLHQQVDFQFIGPGESIPDADLIILPGSKNVCLDRQWLHEQGWDKAIKKHLRYGGKLLGICGGYQMLGRMIFDPQGIEGKIKSSAGLGFFDFETRLTPEKKLQCVTGVLTVDKAKVSGYEIHAGVTQGPALQQPMILLEDKAEGAVSEDGQIMGCYLHGLFDESSACESLLQWAGLTEIESVDYLALREREIDRLAAVFEENIQLDLLFADHEWQQ